MESNNSEIIIYQTEDGKTKVNVRLDDNSVWLSQNDLVELFQTSKSNISEHIKHIFNDGELEEDSVVRKFRTTAPDGKNYNFDELSMVEKHFLATIESAEKAIRRKLKDK